MSNPIRDNAVRSVTLAVKDFRSRDKDRPLSCIRNLNAGILLLIKSRLLEVAGGDEAILAERVTPELVDGQLRWRAKSAKTIDARGIQEHCKAVGITANWAEIDKLTKYRNQIEHHSEDEPRENLKERLSKAFNVLGSFVMDELRQSPAELFGRFVWETLEAQDEAFKKLMLLRDERRSQLTGWPNDACRFLVERAECHVCGSELIAPQDRKDTDVRSAKFACLGCGHTWGFTRLVDELLERERVLDERMLIDGGSQRIGVCRECGESAYDSASRQCVKCSVNGPFECDSCHQVIPTEELEYNGRVCSWCNQVRGRDD